jgi:hypothetical protein
MSTADFYRKLEQQGTAEQLRALERIAAALETLAEHTAPRTYGETAPTPTRCPLCHVSGGHVMTCEALT